MPNYSKGRLIAFLSSILFVFFLWGYVFTPNGLGANIVLGIAIAFAFVYMMTTNLGPFLDDMYFHGGSRERALALRRAEKTAEQISTKLQNLKNIDKSRLENCRNVIQGLRDTVVAIRKKHVKDKKGIDEDIKHITDLEKKAEKIFEETVGQAFKRHGLFTGWFSLATALLAALALRSFVVEPYQIPSGSMIPTLLVGDHLFVSKFSYGVMNPFAKNPTYLFRWATPKPGEVVIFQAPDYVGNNARETWIKRVIAGPGQTVQLKDFVVYVDRKPYNQTRDKVVEYKDYIAHEVPPWKTFTGVHSVETIGSVIHDIYQNEIPIRQGERAWPPPRTLWSGSESIKLPGLDCDLESCRVQEGHVFVMGDNRGHSSDGRFWGALPIDNIKGRALFIWMSVDGSTSSLDLGWFTLPGFRWSRAFNGIN